MGGIIGPQLGALGKERCARLATWKAILVASDDLPIPGRPAMMMRSEGCSPQLGVEVLEPGGDTGEPPSRW